MREDKYLALKIFQRLQDETECQLVLTGSQALYYQSVIEYPQSGFKDLDIIARNPTEKDLELFEKLKALVPTYTQVSSYVKSGWDVKYQFILDNVMVDIFIENDPDFCPNLFLKINEIKDPIPLNPFKRIIAAKKRLNRKKDWKLIHQIVKNLTEGYDQFVEKLLSNEKS